MLRPSAFRVAVVAVGGLVALSCGDDEAGHGDGGTGGAATTGGRAGTGGASSTGGGTASGGAGAGGAGTSGGAPQSGGAGGNDPGPDASAGGTPETGGASSGGASPSSGGSPTSPDASADGAVDGGSDAGSDGGRIDESVCPATTPFGVYALALDWSVFTQYNNCPSCPPPTTTTGSAPGTLEIRSAPSYTPGSVGIEMILEAPGIPFRENASHASELGPWSMNLIYSGATTTPATYVGSEWTGALDGQIITLVFESLVDFDLPHEKVIVTLNTATGAVQSLSRQYNPPFTSFDWLGSITGTGQRACGEEPACTPALSSRCRTANRQRCGSDGDWRTVATCSGNTPYCSGPSSCSSTPPSCAGLPANCGSAQDSSCCTSPLVTGGTFERRINARVAPATISDFRLDKYEVTVGRFRNFVSAWNAGYRPPKGAGKHTHLNGGSGVQGLLAGPAFGAVPELGWQPGRSNSFPSTEGAWATALGCGAQASWTGSAGGNETLPINCVNRYEAAAFCAWDGGFLPTFAEYDYARVGGSEQRVHPWSNPPTSTANDASRACQTPGCIEPVGSHPAGDGKFGQSDLEGNSLEWLLDTGAQPLPTPCTDCASGNFLPTYAVDFYGAEGITRADAYGFRCARVP